MEGWKDGDERVQGMEGWKDGEERVQTMEGRKEREVEGWKSRGLERCSNGKMVREKE